MTAKKLWREYLAMLGPMMLGQTLQTLAITINNIYVGRILGVNALAAVSLFFPILFFFTSFIVGLGNGAAVLVGQAYGAQQFDKIKTVTGAALAIAIVTGALVALLGEGAAPLLRAIGAPPAVLLDAAVYARVMLFGMVIQFVFLLYTTLLRAVGDKTTPFIAFAIAALIAIALTPVLINGWLGLPPQGIASSAYATLLSMLLALLWVCWYLRQCAHPLRIDRALLQHVRWNWRLIKKVLGIGVPAGLQMVVMSIAEMVLLSLVNRYGADATAAYGVIMQVMTYAQFPTMSIAVTASILSSHAIGAGHVAQLQRIVRLGLVFNLLLTGGLVAITCAFAPDIVSIFVRSPTVRLLAQTMLETALWGAILLGMAGVFAAVMRAGGEVIIPTVVTMSGVVAVEVPVAYLLSSRVGLLGIWMAYPIAFAAMLLMQSLYYQCVWRHRAVNRLI